MNVAVEAAKAAFVSWSKKTPLHRARVMFKFKEIIEKNFEELFGSYEITKDNKIFILKPSIRKYKQPQQFTSETSIQNDGLSDVYIAMDYAGDSSTGIGVRFYYNYFVRLIWISFALITIGGIVSFIRRRNEKTI